MFNMSMEWLVLTYVRLLDFLVKILKVVKSWFSGKLTHTVVSLLANKSSNYVTFWCKNGLFSDFLASKNVSNETIFLKADGSSRPPDKFLIRAFA